jgi:hypothetical protein
VAALDAQAVHDVNDPLVSSALDAAAQLAAAVLPQHLMHSHQIEEVEDQDNDVVSNIVLV